MVPGRQVQSARAAGVVAQGLAESCPGPRRLARWVTAARSRGRAGLGSWVQRQVVLVAEVALSVSSRCGTNYPKPNDNINLNLEKRKRKIFRI